MKPKKKINKTYDSYSFFHKKNGVSNFTELIGLPKDNLIKIGNKEARKKVNKVNHESNSKITDLLKKMNITYDNKDLYLYEVTLTHKSYANEHDLPYDNQRLEFLGDSVINFLVTKFLYEYKNLSEGEMTKARISIVQSKTLARAARKLQLQKYLRIGRGLEYKNLSDAVMEDAFEALMGAIYINQQRLENVSRILHNTILKWYLVDDLKNTIDYKTKFQELIQARNSKANIQYLQTSNSKPLNFEVELWCDDKKYAVGKGRKLKDAEINAAKQAFLKFKKI